MFSARPRLLGLIAATASLLPAAAFAQREDVGKAPEVALWLSLVVAVLLFAAAAVGLFLGPKRSDQD